MVEKIENLMKQFEENPLSKKSLEQYRADKNSEVAEAQYNEYNDNNVQRMVRDTNGRVYRTSGLENGIEVRKRTVRFELEERKKQELSEMKNDLSTNVSYEARKKALEAEYDRLIEQRMEEIDREYDSRNSRQNQQRAQKITENHNKEVEVKSFFSTKNMQAINAGIREAENQINNKRLELSKIANEISASRRALENEKASKKGDLELKLANKDIEINEYFNNLRNGNKPSKTINDLYKERDELKSQIDSIDKDDSQFKKEIEKLTEQRSKAAKELNDLENDRQKYVEFLNKMKNVMSQFKDTDFKEIDQYSNEKDVSDKKAPDGKTPDGKTPDGKTPNGKTPDGKTPDGKTPDGKTPNGKTPDRKTPDGKAPEFMPPVPVGNDKEFMPPVPVGEDKEFMPPVPVGRTPQPTPPPVVKSQTQMGRSFFEIVADTDTVHIGNIEGKMHSLAQQPLFRTGIIESLRKGDPVGAITGFVPKTISSVIMLGPKVVSKVACAIRGTNKKYDELKKNIADLSPEEFAILTEDNGYTDYSLNPITMTQFKFNDKYLEAIKSRVDAERNNEKESIQKEMNKLQQEKAAIEAELQKGGRTPEEMGLLTIEATNRSRQIGALETEMQRAESRRLAFEDGMDLKSSRKKNIEGWIAAKHNPDNIRDHIQMAHFSEKRRIARENGDHATELQMDNDMKQYIAEQTKMACGHISRGNYQKAQVTMSREAQTKGREIFTTIAVTSAIAAAVKAVQIDAAKVSEQQRLDAQINGHNNNINAHNQAIHAQGQQLSGQQITTIDDKTISGAVNYVQHSNAANIRNADEIAFLNEGAAATGKGWDSVNEFPNLAADQAIHAREATTIQGVSSNLNTQDYADAINSSVNDMNASMSAARAAEQAYQAAPGHGQFDVTRFLDSSDKAVQYSDAFKQFFTDALTQNEQISTILSQTPITTTAPQMGGFTINIPSAVIPASAALVASAINAYESSDKAAKKVVADNKEKQEEKAKKRAEKEAEKAKKKEEKEAAKAKKKEEKQSKSGKADPEEAQIITMNSPNPNKIGSADKGDR